MEKSRLCTWEMKGNIGVLAVDHPPKNTLTEAEFVSLDVLRTWTGTPGLKALVVTGAGRHFSAGADRESIFQAAKDPSSALAQMLRGTGVLLHLEDLEVPVIAAIRGACMGGGLEIALACDIRVCAANALLAFPETGLNLIPGLNGTLRLPRLIGRSRALQFLLSGDLISGQQALELGLVDRVVSSGEVFSAAIGLAAELTENRPVRVIRAIMRSLNNSRKLSWEEAAREEARLFCELAAEEASRLDRENA